MCSAQWICFRGRLNQFKLTIISNCKKITFYIVVFAIVLYYFEKTYMEFNGKVLGAFHLEKKFGNFGGNKNGFSDR